ncbi:MAG: PAS domain S-box protein, partial [Caldilineaceae bacterium]|nr:PAS domain S-box protein [Caldilineaceae bacterium]
MQNEKTSASTTDIAAQKSRTLDTSIDEMLFRLMVESAPIAIVAINDSGKIVYTNEKLDELFGYDYGELIGRDLELLVPQKLRHIHRQHQSDYIQQPHVRPMGSGMDLRGVRKDGVEFPIEAGLSFVRVGGEMLVMSSVTDMTRRKHIEEILERRVEERTQEIDQRRRIADSMRDILARLNANYS